MRKYFSGSIAIVVLIFTLNRADAQDKKTIQIDSLIDHVYQLGLFNGNVLIAEKGDVVYKASMGFAEAAKKNRLTDQYKFLIGSVVKEFSAVGIMMLSERGKLSIEDKLSKYLPELPEWAEKMSIKELLQHANDKDSIVLQQKLVEKLTGLSFSQFIADELFKPSGIHILPAQPKEQESFVAKSFNNDHQQDNFDLPSSLQIYLTLDDLYAWLQHLYQLKPINVSAVKQLLVPVEKDKPSALGYGIMEGDKWISHMDIGSILNSEVFFSSNIPKGRTIILMSNNKNIKLSELNNIIQAILDGKPYNFPKKSLFQKIEKQLNALNGHQIVAFYEYLKSKNNDEYNFGSEKELENIGHYLMEKSRFDDAIEVFKHNVKLFPKSGNVFLNLAEAFYKKGDEKEALVNYKKSLSLDPLNKTAKEMVLKLEKK
ncbi:serine hydrolase [Pedobacter nutrimenti]|uniref:serine hydrolase n=1 Tax=Pedobacter nutrimenti TaxID=1241337 RepID=UPI00292F2305|nr:serine hydrolase [Pedobacter nutrimenti]